MFASQITWSLLTTASDSLSLLYLEALTLLYIQLKQKIPLGYINAVFKGFTGQKNWFYFA